MGRAKTASGPPRAPILSPLAREGADGQAVVCPLLRGSSPTRGVAPKQHRVSGVLSLRHFSGWFSLSLGAWVPKNLARRSFGLLVSPARCCSTGSGRLDLDLMISGPPRSPILSPLAREGADGLAVVCPLLRGSSPTRWVAPKQHRTRRLLTNRPCSSLVYEESDSKERLRVSNWIVQRLYMQSRKPSNSDF